ncbi:TonB-dependent receptor domain-containing protein [Solimonas soli]|uniref:TonB-dependent receptor domain-containing protein n=1 Tax=Solimonas soli TaxID=413479 RepID=UPI0004B5EDEB|nr:TonB-dependent receptor [Solimonas soli]
MLFAALQARAVRADLASETEFHIDAQPLATALTAFADATHIQIVMAADDLGDRRSPGIRGRATAVAALGELLRGTSLHFQIISADTVAIVAADAAPPDAAPSLGQLDDVVVVGHGYTRASNTLAPQEAPAKAPGAPVQSLLGDLPGVNVQNSDPYGLYEFGNSVRIRGFASDQLGISLDGVPLESYDVRDGTPPGRLVDDDDLASVTVAQGSGDVMMPSYHALGGSVRYSTGEPLGVRDMQLTATGGSNDLTRLRARIDTPPWWAGGPEAHFSASRTRATQFDNAHADMGVDHAGVKLAQDFGAFAATLIYRYGKRDDHDMQNYDAQGHVLSGFDLLETPTGDPERDALYYGYWTNGRTDQLLSLQLRATPAEGLALQLQPYFEHKRGYGYAGVAPSAAEAQYAASIDPDSGVPGRDDNLPYDGSGITERRETLRGNRDGATIGASFEGERHTISAGGWYERYRFDQDRSLYNVDDDGLIEDRGPPIVNYYDRHFDTQVLQFYAKDSSRWFDERLRIDVGFKGLHVDRDFSGTANVAAYDAQQLARIGRVDHDYFQPQFGLTCKLDETRELFANYADNFSAAPRNALSAENYESLLRPETSHNIDFGLRSLGKRVSASATLYYIDYAHRILELTVSDPFMISEEIYRNVGSIHTYGIEFAAYARPLRGLRIGGTLSLNRSVFQNDYERYDEDTQAMQRVAVAGKTLPDTPNLMAGLGAQYRAGRFSADVNAKYTGRRYSTATNDEHVAGYAVVDAALGYELAPRSARAGGLQLQLQVYNLLDEHYIGYITPAEFVDNDNHGQFFLGTPRTAYLSLSASFR